MRQVHPPQQILKPRVAVEASEDRQHMQIRQIGISFLEALLQPVESLTVITGISLQGRNLNGGGFQALKDFGHIAWPPGSVPGLYQPGVDHLTSNDRQNWLDLPNVLSRDGHIIHR